MNEELPLHILNICAKGVSIADAKKIADGEMDRPNPSADEPKPSEPNPSADEPKTTATEVKNSIAIKIEELGGEIPPQRASVAEFKRALAKAES